MGTIVIYNLRVSRFSYWTSLLVFLPYVSQTQGKKQFDKLTLSRFWKIS